MIHSQNNNNTLNIPQITVSEQSTVSSPGWSANPISWHQGEETVGDSVGVAANAAAMIQQQFNGVQHDGRSKVIAASRSNNDTTAPSVTALQPLPNQEIQIKQHQFQLQLHQLQSINSTMAVVSSAEERTQKTSLDF